MRLSWTPRVLATHRIRAVIFDQAGHTATNETHRSAAIRENVNQRKANPPEARCGTNLV
jgi:hypothetical protein